MSATIPALLRDPKGIIRIPCRDPEQPEALIDADDFRRLVRREDLCLDSYRVGRYHGVFGVPRLRYRPGRAPRDPNERAALPALVLRPLRGSKVVFVDPSRPYDCTRSNLKIVPIGGNE
ncbi:hypothetical protein [Xylophilus sp. GOD-11R]|uniref:hypothetical protein n=1 Tax=Xylophilus sp. GOD-11R TaxID=3089814 RepID=UPI00298D22E6|nr:hypothetical protein [Xylophilus sp. GOD-11R]WPB57675.1 hypothetical protein R9X41_03205 [Xylophilus sp. GOD-11R]